MGSGILIGPSLGPNHLTFRGFVKGGSRKLWCWWFPPPTCKGHSSNSTSLTSLLSLKFKVQLGQSHTHLGVSFGRYPVFALDSKENRQDNPPSFSGRDLLKQHTPHLLPRLWKTPFPMCFQAAVAVELRAVPEASRAKSEGLSKQPIAIGGSQGPRINLAGLSLCYPKSCLAGLLWADPNQKPDKKNKHHLESVPSNGNPGSQARSCCWLFRRSVGSHQKRTHT